MIPLISEPSDFESGSQYPVNKGSMFMITVDETRFDNNLLHLTCQSMSKSLQVCLTAAAEARSPALPAVSTIGLRPTWLPSSGDVRLPATHGD